MDPLQIGDVDLVLMEVCKGPDGSKQLLPLGYCEEDGSYLSAAGRNAPFPLPLLLLLSLLPQLVATLPLMLKSVE